MKLFPYLVLLLMLSLGCGARPTKVASPSTSNAAVEDFFSRQDPQRLDLANRQELSEGQPISERGGWLRGGPNSETRRFAIPAKDGGNAYVYTLILEPDPQGNWVVASYHIDRVRRVE